MLCKINVQKYKDGILRMCNKENIALNYALQYIICKQIKFSTFNCFFNF